MNEETYDFTPVPVDEVPKPSIKRNVNIITDDVIATLSMNPNQWFRIFTYNGDAFMKVYATAQTSTHYWKNKLQLRNNLILDCRVRRSTPNKSVEVYAQITSKESHATNTN